jgi:hypothetical protein
MLDLLLDHHFGGGGSTGLNIDSPMSFRLAVIDPASSRAVVRPLIFCMISLCKEGWSVPRQPKMTAELPSGRYAATLRGAAFTAWQMLNFERYVGSAGVN